MSETGPLARGLAGDCMVESAEGPVAMRDTPNKGFAVLTRLPSGQLGFRQLIKVVESGPVPLVRVVLDSGHTAVVARDHVFYRVGLEPVPAARLRPGDQLETAFRYPGDYAPPDATTPVRQTVAVRAIEPAGEGQVWAGTVRDPPANRPAPPEIATCRRWLLGELALLPRLRVAVALGKVAHDGFLAAERARGAPLPRPLPRFAHGAEHRLASGLVLLSSYHPSQQNTFTGKLTRRMLDAVFARARALIAA